MQNSNLKIKPKRLITFILILLAIPVVVWLLFTIFNQLQDQAQAGIFPNASISPSGTSTKNNSPTFKPSEQVSFTLHLNQKFSLNLPFFAVKKAAAQEQSKNEWQGDGLKILFRSVLGDALCNFVRDAHLTFCWFKQIV